MKTCAVIPAAGKGSRLGSTMPKLLQPITKNVTVWSILRHKLIDHAEHIHLTVSPQHYELFQQILFEDIHHGLVTISIQPEPIGMGDAVFCGHSVWSQAKHILIIWGDQLHVSAQTFKQCMDLHNLTQKTIVLPLTKKHTPYVEYIFHNNTLQNILQSREGDICHSIGWSDVGTFLLSTDTLLTAWKEYLTTHPISLSTKEINFLPFLVFLVNKGWRVRTIDVEDNDEARGINTQEDLIYFQSVYKEQFL